MSTESLAAFLQGRMREMGYKSNGQLAIAAGVPASTLGPIIRGGTERPDVLTLSKIARPLHVSFEELCRMAVGLPAPESEQLSEEIEDQRIRRTLRAIYARLRTAEERERFRRWVEATGELFGAGAGEEETGQGDSQ